MEADQLALRPIEKKTTVHRTAFLLLALFAASAILAGAGPASAQAISDVVATNVTNSSTVITWTTSLPSGSQVNYGTTTGYGASSPADPTLVTAHSATLTGLTANTLYNFDVVSVNTSANFDRSPILPTMSSSTGMRPGSARFTTGSLEWHRAR